MNDPIQFAKLVSKYFEILKQHCRGSQTNSELVSATFKAVTALIGSSYGPLTDNHLKILLAYAEEDLFNQERQAAAFPLLQALLKRKNICDEMEIIGRKVLKLTVQADTETGRNAARNYFVNFLLEVSCGFLKVQKIIQFRNFKIVEFSNLYFKRSYAYVTYGMFSIRLVRRNCLDILIICLGIYNTRSKPAVSLFWNVFDKSFLSSPKN